MDAGLNSSAICSRFLWKKRKPWRRSARRVLRNGKKKKKKRNRKGDDCDSDREVFGSMPRCRIALENGDAVALGEPIAERRGIGSDRGACAQRALDRRERKKDERLDARTLARLARIDPQLTIEGPPFPHKRGPASCEAITY